MGLLICQDGHNQTLLVQKVQGTEAFRCLRKRAEVCSNYFLDSVLMAMNESNTHFIILIYRFRM